MGISRKKEVVFKYMPIKVGRTFPVVITSYDVALNDYKVFARYKWKYLVVDEVKWKVAFH